MLHEFVNVSQVGSGRRRLFTDERFDLYVWYKGIEISGFQLVYGGLRRFAFSWLDGEGFSHLEVDGWDNKAYEGTPLLVIDGTVDLRVFPEAIRALDAIDPSVRDYVVRKFREYEKTRSTEVSPA